MESIPDIWVHASNRKVVGRPWEPRLAFIESFYAICQPLYLFKSFERSEQNQFNLRYNKCIFLSVQTTRYIDYFFIIIIILLINLRKIQEQKRVNIRLI